MTHESPLFATQAAPVLERIVADYFADPAFRLRIPKGGLLLNQGMGNDRLYYVLRGALTCTMQDEDEIGDEVQVELFRAEKGSFIGVYSFFSGNRHSFIRATALEDTELAWIGRETPPVDEETRGSLREQFFPVVVEELSKRQISLSHMAQDQAVVQRRLHLAEKMSTLGALSAGLAHELNNAVGVVARSADHLRQVLSALFLDVEPGLAPWFEAGVEKGQNVASGEVRRRAKELMARFPALEYDKAKALARILGDDPDATPAGLPDRLDETLFMWETGRACHDLRLAAEHAASIVRSIRRIGGSGNERRETDVADSIREALALLHSNLREVTVELDLPENLPPIWANKTELVQIWVNIIKNGWDAVKNARTADPRIRVAAHRHRRAVQVDLANNGPPIAPALLRRLFRPHITTKRETAEMGLGLGLYIVKEIVDRYSGELHVTSDETETCFSILLPLGTDKNANQEDL